MGQIIIPNPAKLITGFIFKDEQLYSKTKTILEKKYGKTDYESPSLNFNYTGYYREEMGDGLLRKFVSFAKLIPPQSIPEIKILTNKIEKLFAINDARRINLDPGYLDMAKLVLATTKDFKHRIYLNKGIYAEITLSYQGKSFCPGECTYPDYRTAEYIAVFNQIRQIYANQTKKMR